MPVILDIPVTYWKCPACGLTDRTQRPEVHTQMHACPALSGLNAPLVHADEDAVYQLNVREDYEGQDHGNGLVYHDGRPIMSLSTRFADGREGVNIFAPTARFTLS